MKEIEVSISVDTELLEQFKALCNELGVTVEDVAKVFFEAVVRDRNVLLALIEDAEDIAAHEEAMLEYRRNPVSRPITDLWHELDLV